MGELLLLSDCISNDLDALSDKLGRLQQRLDNLQKEAVIVEIKLDASPDSGQIDSGDPFNVALSSFDTLPGISSAESEDEEIATITDCLRSNYFN